MIPLVRVFGALACGFATLPLAVALAQDEPVLRDVVASRIVTISDGDFLASTYSDEILAPYGRYPDMLTVLTRHGNRFTRSSVEASNSVTAAPEILTAAPDGRTFYAVDRLARATPEARNTPDLAFGRTLTAARIGSDGRVAILAAREIADSPEALAVSPDGRWLAIVSNAPDRSMLTLVPMRDGVPGDLIAIDDAALGLAVEGPGARGGVLFTNVQWRPDGRALAINDTGRSRIAFFLLSDDDASRLRPWGAPVAAGKDPFVGRFSVDGRHYLTSEWGRDFTARDLDDRLPTTPGTLGVTRLSDDGRHVRISSVPVGNAPEGMAISPDGRLVATINMRSTAFPETTPRFTRQASVSLTAFDPDSGALKPLGETFFEGVLPEGGTFDATGRHLLVTVFQGHATQRDQSGLVVFRVEGLSVSPSLIERGRIAMPHGTHHVLVVP